MNNPSAFSTLLEKSQAYQAAQDAKNQAKIDLQIALDKKRKATRESWLRETLQQLGIYAEIVNGKAVVDGLEFSILYLTDELTHNEGWHTTPTDPDKWLPKPLNRVSFGLRIRNLWLREEFLSKRPDRNFSYCENEQRISVDGSGNYWEQTANEVVKAIEHLRAEEAAGPERKAKIDAEWNAQQQQWAEQRQREEQEQAERDAQWEEQKTKQAAERAAREQAEAEMRAEVAAKLALKPATFDYLIEVIVNELQRQSSGVGYYDE